MSTISIIGAGWLGMPLAEKLKQQQHELALSRREIASVEALRQAGWIAESFSLGDSVPNALGNSEIAVINIPPGRRTLNSEEFIQNTQELCSQLSQSAVKNIIFVSTTSVYGDTSGIVTEVTEPRPVTNSGVAHLKIEQFIHQLIPARATVIRLAGLVGGNRHPAKILSGKQQIATPNQVVNLIHREDVIRAIIAIIEKQIWGHTLHLSAHEHPKRGDYYPWAAKQMGIALPEFMQATSSEATGKQIDAKYSLEILGIELKYPSPYDMLPQDP